MDETWILVAVAFMVAAYVKGATAMGFPLIATPMVALLVDIRTAYVLLLAPNILMDVFQIARGGPPWRLWRRLGMVLAAIVPGVFLGTAVLLAVPERAVYVALAGMILLFLSTRRLGASLRVPARLEPGLGAAVGLLGGTLNGLTNAVGPVAAVYLLALDLPKRDLVRGLASVFLTAKVSQLAAISGWGLYTGPLVLGSCALSLAALGAFWLGLRTQDRVRQETFRTIMSLLLFCMALFFIYRGLLA